MDIAYLTKEEWDIINNRKFTRYGYWNLAIAFHVDV